jgi:hypothetical protein
MQINDLLAHDKDDSDYFTDAWAENILVSHNIYTYHHASIDACDLIFHEQKRDMSRVPDPYAECWLNKFAPWDDMNAKPV